MQAKGLSVLLRTDLDTGVTGNEDELARRRNAFGSNTYPVKKGRSFLVIFLSDCYFGVIICSSLTEIIFFLFKSLFNFLGFDLVQNFLWEAWQDLTLIILIIAAAASLALGIKTEVLLE